MKITKEKNFINFEAEENKVYRMDINTGDIIGLRGKPLVTMPKAINIALTGAEYGIFALTPLISEVGSYSGGIHMDTIKRYLPLMQLLDALQSVGYVPSDTETDGVKWSCGRAKSLRPHELKSVNPHEFLKWAEKRKEEGYGTNFNSLAIYAIEVIDEKKKSLFNPKTEREAEILETIFKREILAYTSYDILEKELEFYKLIFKMYSQNKFYEIDKNYDISSPYRSSTGLNICKNIANQIITICNAWEKPLPTKDPYRFYVDNIESYKLWQEKEKDKIFEVNQLKKDLTFTYGEFTVVIPTKTMDLVEEGEKMHHCVGNGTYAQGVINGIYNIVFIRRKDDVNTPYITAQIYKDGTYGGYYKAWDRRIDLPEDFEFKTAYLKHLATILSEDN